MIAQRLQQLIADQPELRPVLRKAQRLMQLQRIYVENTPARLSRMSRVADLHGSTLIVVADGGAVGAKLKLLAPTLLNNFLENGQQVTAIKVEVQANLRAAPTPQPAPVLPPQAIQSLAGLVEQLEDGPLRRAVQQLLDTRRS